MPKKEFEKYDMIIGEKVRLRPITVDDADLIVKWRNTQEVKENFIFRESFTLEMHLQWMKDKIETKNAVQYIIEDIVNNMPVGSVYFRDINYTFESAEFGIFIGEKDARGRKIGLEATKLFIDFGMNVLKLHRIFLRLLSDNKIAYQMYIKAGFVKEGVFRDMVKLDGQYKDIIFMSKLAVDKRMDY